jgi:hypothetical protein
MPLCSLLQLLRDILLEVPHNELSHVCPSVDMIS